MNCHRIDPQPQSDPGAEQSPRRRQSAGGADIPVFGGADIPVFGGADIPVCPESGSAGGTPPAERTRNNGRQECLPHLRSAPAWGIFLLAAILPTGCGYHWSDNSTSGGTPEPNYAWRGLYRQDVKTVAVPVFTNRTYYRGIEFNLSKAVINEIESRTPYKVVPRETADTLLEGEIIHIQVRTLSRSPFNALPQEQLYQLSVNLVWKDLRTGKILAQRHNFEQTAPYYPTLGEDPFVGSQENIEKLAVAIVEQLEAEWGKPQKKE